MSGTKRATVRVYEDEYRRLQEQAKRLRRIQEELPAIMEELWDEVSRDLRRSLEPLEQRQQRLQEALQGVRSEVRAAEEGMARRLEQEQRRMRTALQDARRDLQQLITDQGRHFEELLAEEREQRENQIRQIQERILADEQRKEELARSWLEAARVVLDFVDGNYRHQQFAPGELERLERDLRQAEENVNQGVWEAVLAQAQRAYHDLSDLRLKLEQLEREWELWRSAALQAASGVLAQVQRNRTCKAIDLEGQETDVALEVDWWTEGALSRLEEEVKALIGRIRDEESPMSTEELRRAVETMVPEMRQRLYEVIAEAQRAALGSQLRINIADVLVDVLERQGYTLDEGNATYEGEDMRGGYLAKVRHLDGSEVVVRVVPRGSGSLENDWEIHSYDVEQRSEHELRQRAAELARALAEEGLRTEEPRQVAQTPDQALRDIQAVRARRQVPLRQTAG